MNSKNEFKKWIQKMNSKNEFKKQIQIMNFNEYKYGKFGEKILWYTL